MASSRLASIAVLKNTEKAPLGSCGFAVALNLGVLNGDSMSFVKLK